MPAGATDDVNITNTEVPAALAATLRMASSPTGTTSAGAEALARISWAAAPSHRYSEPSLLEQEQVRTGGDWRRGVAVRANGPDQSQREG